MDASVISMNGISFFLIEGLQKIQNIPSCDLTKIQKLIKNNLAAGIIYYEDNRIQPVVYVSPTNSLIWESACGSGSIAYSLLTGRNEITQPSGEKISIKTNSNNISISVEFKRLNFTDGMLQ